MVFEIHIKTASMVSVLLINSKFYGIILLNALAILASVAKASIVQCLVVHTTAHQNTVDEKERKKERKKRHVQMIPSVHHHVCSNG